jgi:hypothetical protein
VITLPPPWEEDGMVAELSETGKDALASRELGSEETGVSTLLDGVVVLPSQAVKPNNAAAERRSKLLFFIYIVLSFMLYRYRG